MKTLLLILTVVSVSGCASIADLVVWPHDRSNIREKELVCLEPELVPETAPALLFLGPVVEAAAGLLLDQAAKAIERESKRYKATYSARLPERLLTWQAQDQARLRVGAMAFRRYAGPGAPTACGGESDKALLTFKVALETTSTGDAIRLIPHEFSIKGTKAKVAALDADVEVNVQVAVAGVAQGKEGAATVDFGRADFPMGKIKLGEMAGGKAVVKTADDLKHLASPWFALPAFRQPKTMADFAPVTFTVTVIEANDLGDVIAKGGTTLAEQRAKIVEELLKALGLKEKK